jgi:hypothetical protein
MPVTLIRVPGQVNRIFADRHQRRLLNEAGSAREHGNISAHYRHDRPVGDRGCLCRRLRLRGRMRGDLVLGPLQGSDLRARSAAGGPTDGGARQRRGAASFWGTVAHGIQLDGYSDNVTSWTGHEFTFPLSAFFGDAVGPPVYVTVDVTVEVSYTP